MNKRDTKINLHNIKDKRVNLIQILELFLKKENTQLEEYGNKTRANPYNKK